MHGFLAAWADAATTSLGFFWMALWAFAFGYLVSSLVQVLVTPDGMREAMGRAGPRSVGLAAFFGFLSSSCSFAALATTRTLLAKGAGLVPAVAFLLASTNLVVELGIVIAIFLGWQFVVGEYVGGLLLIGLAWLFIRLTHPTRLLERVRERLDAGDADGDGPPPWRQVLSSRSGWQRIGRRYVMEWQMVWKDVLVGFTVAGIIAAFVPDAFFQSLFPGAGGEHAGNPGFLAVLAQVLVAPLAAFMTFIGSMGNIPLAALLFDRGVSFAGVMAFIFSDLVVLPVLRINARYYGWRMALYLLGLMLACLVLASLALHYGLWALDRLPVPGAGDSPADRDLFAFGTGFVLNLVFLAASAGLAWLWWRQRHDGGHGHGHDHDHGGGATWSARLLQAVAALSALWLAGGLAVSLWVVG